MLFSDDLRLIFLPYAADPYIDSILFQCFIAFCTELTLSCIASPDYVFSFFFWLDLISVITLITDIYFMVYLIFESDTVNLPNPATSFADIVNVGKASRVGARAGRIIRLLRIIKLMRVAKLYRQT